MCARRPSRSPSPCGGHDVLNFRGPPGSPSLGSRRSLQARQPPVVASALTLPSAPCHDGWTREWSTCGSGPVFSLRVRAHCFNSARTAPSAAKRRIDVMALRRFPKGPERAHTLAAFDAIDSETAYVRFPREKSWAMSVTHQKQREVRVQRPRHDDLLSTALAASRTCAGSSRRPFRKRS